VTGIVLRERRPRAATVTAYLIHRGPDDPDSVDAWEGMDPTTEHYDGMDATPRGSAEAGADGKWSLSGLRGGEYLVEARDADGWGGNTIVDCRSDGSPVPWPGRTPEPETIVLRPAPCSLRGRALNLDGSPFAGLVLARHGGDLFVPAATDAEGRFALRGLPASTVEISALVPGARETPGPSVILPRDDPVEFVVGAGLEAEEAVAVDDATGAPLEGAFVRTEAYGFPTWAVELLRTDAAGRFPVRLLPGRWTTVTIRAPGLVPFEDSVEADRRRPRGSLVFRLRRPAKVSGRVVTRDGAPAAGAEVVVLPEVDAAGVPAWRATADADGEFALEGAPAGEAVVLVAGGGFLSAGALGPAPWHRRDHVVRLVPEGVRTRDLVAVPCARAKGRVVDASGAPVAGARVQASQPSVGREGGLPGLLEQTPEVETGPDGSFVVPFLVPGHAAEWTAEDDRGTRAVDSSPPAPPGGEVEVLLRAPADRTLAVRVVDAPTGEPMEGVEVDAAARFGERDRHSLDGEWITGADGTVVVGPVPAVPLRLRPFHRQPWWWGEEVEVGAEESGPVVLRVDPLERPGPLSVAGRVVGPDGAPVRGVAVECGTSGEWTCMGFTGDTVLTDPEGRFRIDGLHPASYEVRVETERDGRTLAGSATAEGGAADVVVALRDRAREEAGLDDPDLETRLRFRVLGPEGGPVRSGDVSLLYLAPDGGNTWTGTEIVDGMIAERLHDRVPGTRVWIEVSGVVAEGNAAARPAHGVFGPFPAVPGEVEIRLGAGGAIEGRVVGPSGDGIPGAHVHLLAGRTRGSEGEIPGGSRIEDGIADGEGRFRIEGVGDGEYEVLASAGPAWVASPESTVRAGARDVRLVLRPAVAPLVTVLDPDGKPVEGARVQAGQFGGFRSPDADGRTNAAGMVRLEGLDPDAPARLEVEPPRMLRPRVLTEEREDWKPADTVVRLATGLDLAVLVQDPSGRPVPAAVVWYAPERGPDVPGGWSSEETGDDGIARIGRLAPGRVVLRAELFDVVPRWGSGPGPGATAAISADARGRATLTLDPGLSVRVRLEGVEVPGDVAGTLVGGDPDRERRGRRAGDLLVFRGLEPGEDYDVYLRERNGDRVALLLGVKAGGDPVAPAWGPAASIRGTARLPAGSRPFSVLARLGRVTRWASFDERTGEFEFDDLPEGTWTLRFAWVAAGEERGLDVRTATGATVEIDAR
jgi:protocatechuate 3,4-dioxygenase beta subunit